MLSARLISDIVSYDLWDQGTPRTPLRDRFRRDGVLGWFRRRFVRRNEFDAMKAIYETRIRLLEAELEMFDSFGRAKLSRSNAGQARLQLLKDLAQKASREH